MQGEASLLPAAGGRPYFERVLAEANAETDLHVSANLGLARHTKD